MEELKVNHDREESEHILAKLNYDSLIQPVQKLSVAYRISINAKKLISIAFLLATSTLATAQNFGTKTAKVLIFSSTPIEDIKAVTDKGVGILIPKSKEVVFQIPIKSFAFAKGLMQEHFNENYMESDKFPYAKFKGNIQQEIDLSKDAVFPVTVKGILNIHGVDRPRTIAGQMEIKNGAVKIATSFDVPCADHKIKIPSLVVTKVAEVIKVSVDALLNPLSK